MTASCSRKAKVHLALRRYISRVSSWTGWGKEKLRGGRKEEGGRKMGRHLFTRAS
jgi:hypothetical protein